MCYSNSLSASLVQLESTYGRGTSLLKDFFPRYISSGFSHPIWPVITQEKNFIPMQWGLVPSWYRGIAPFEIASKTLNARIETLDEKASFKHLVQHQRCIIPSTGFFESQSLEKRKKPFFIYPNKGLFFHMAGVYDCWVDVSNRVSRHSFTIITTEANNLMAEIHNTQKRMPLMLTNEQFDEYLQGMVSMKSLRPLPESHMTYHAINKRIFTSSENNVPSVQHRIEDNIGTQGLLF